MTKKTFTPKKQLIILGTIYKIKFEDLSSIGAYGECNWKEKVIRLDNECKKDYALYMKVLIHELSHAVFEEAALHQTSIHPDIEEIIVEQIANAVYDNLL